MIMIMKGYKLNKIRSKRYSSAVHNKVLVCSNCFSISIRQCHYQYERHIKSYEDKEGLNSNNLLKKWNRKSNLSIKKYKPHNQINKHLSNLNNQKRNHNKIKSSSNPILTNQPNLHQGESKSRNGKLTFVP